MRVSLYFLPTKGLDQATEMKIIAQSDRVVEMYVMPRVGESIWLTPGDGFVLGNYVVVSVEHYIKKNSMIVLEKSS